MSATGTAGGAGSAARPIRKAVVPNRLLARIAVAVALAGLLASGYLLWLRDSALVRVQTVTITGLTSNDAGRVRAALAAAARGMTTLHVDQGELRKAVAAFPVVRSIEARPDFPRAMRIHVVEHRPAAFVMSGRRRVPVAADGSVLSGLPVRGPLPVVKVRGPVPPDVLTGAAQLEAVRVAAGRPAALAGRIDEVRKERGRGLVVPVEGGPLIVFGDATKIAAKWAAAVRLLADLGARGAYVDVRIPERPVAGGVPPTRLPPAAPAASAAVAGRTPAPAQAQGSPAPDASSGGPAGAPARPEAPAGAAPGAPAAPRAGTPQATAGEGGGATAEVPR